MSREQRILSVWWPRLAIERWARTRARGNPPDAAVEGTHGPVIHAVTRAAAERGARAGARLTDARALEPALVAVAADPAGDAALVERLARWAGRWSPAVEVDGADGLRLDIGGVAHLFGSEAGLVADVEARFAGLGLTVRVAVAATPGAAWALARYCPSPRAGEGLGRGGTDSASPLPARAARESTLSRKGRGTEEDLAALLAPLPVAALRLSPQATRTLERLGLKTIGALAGVPRRSLARRFREADNPIDALDRALGRTPEPLTATRAEPPPRSTLRLAEPVADPAILATALARLADPLVRALAARRLGARRIVFHAYRVDGEVGEAAAETARPTRDAAHIVRLLSDRLERLDPGFGFDGFALIAAWCEPLGAEQDALLGEPPKEFELARLIDRLVARLGADRVRRPVRRESHLPEMASGWTPATSSLRAKRSNPAKDQLDCRAPAGLAMTARPQRLLDAPEAIAVIYATPEGVPWRFVWRRAVHDIARVEGPERIAPEWWWQPAGTRLRDYYRVEDAAGRRFWIYREGVVGDGRGGAPAWYLHGLFG